MPNPPKSNVTLAPPAVPKVKPKVELVDAGFLGNLYSHAVASIENIPENLAGLGQAVGKATGVTQTLEKINKTNPELAGRSGTKVAELLLTQPIKRVEPGQDVDLRDVLAGKASAGSFAGAAIGGSAASMGATVAGGALGSIGGPVGSLIGATAANYIFSAGSLYLDWVEKGVDEPVAALATSLPVSALDAITPLKALGIGAKKALQEVAAETGKRVALGYAKNIGADIVSEGVTEGAQEAVTVGAERILPSFDEYNRKNPDVLWRIANSVVGGLVAGGAFGAVAPHKGAETKGEDTKTEPAPLKTDATETTTSTSAVPDVNTTQAPQQPSVPETLPTPNPTDQMVKIVEAVTGEGEGTPDPKLDLSAAMFAMAERMRNSKIDYNYNTDEYEFTPLPKEGLEAQLAASIANAKKANSLALPEVLDTDTSTPINDVLDFEIVEEDDPDVRTSLVETSIDPKALEAERQEDAARDTDRIISSIIEDPKSIMGLLDDAASVGDIEEALKASAPAIMNNILGSSRDGSSVNWAKVAPIIAALQPAGSQLEEDLQKSIAEINSKRKASTASTTLGSGLGGLAPTVSNLASKFSSWRRSRSLSLSPAGTVRNLGTLGVNLRTIRQLSWSLPEFKPLKKFVEAIDSGLAVTNQIKVKADIALRDVQNVLDDNGRRQLGTLARAVFKASRAAKTRLQDGEINNIAIGLKVPVEVLDAYKTLKSLSDTFVDTMFQSTTTHAQRLHATNQARLNQELSAINQGFKRFRDYDWFPDIQFGKYLVEVRKPNKGGTSSKLKTFVFDTQKEQEDAVAAIKASNSKLQVGASILSDVDKSMMGLPVSFLRTVVSDLELTPNQARRLNSLIGGNYRGASVLRSLRRRNYNPISDPIRSFAFFSQSIANHLGRAESLPKMKEATEETYAIAEDELRTGGNATPTKLLAHRMQSIMDDTARPSVFNTVLAGAMFTYYFAYVPSQVVVNLTQIPMFLAPHLTGVLRNYGIKAGIADAKAAKIVGQAIISVSRLFRPEASTALANFRGSGKHIDPEILTGMQTAIDTGILDPSFTIELAAIVHKGVLQKAVEAKVGETKGRQIASFVRGFFDAGISPFRVSEEFNKRVAFVAAYQLAIDIGITNPYDFAVNVVHKTMFSYSRHDRLNIANGTMAPLFIFKTYMQHALFFYGHEAGQGRALLALALLAGVEGLPLAQNFLALFNLLGTKTKEALGMKNPKVDLEQTLREFLNEVLGMSDSILHGITRSGPFDLSASFSLGDIGFGVTPTLQGLEGSLRSDIATNRVVREIMGVAGAQGMNFLRGAIDQTPDADLWRRMALPRAMRNSWHSYSTLREGQAEVAGDTIVKYNPANPKDLALILGKALGFKPTVETVTAEKASSYKETHTYYTIRRQMMVHEAVHAFLRKDPALRKAMQVELSKFNKSVPAPFKINSKDIHSAMVRLTKNRKRADQGYPTRNFLREWAAPYVDSVK